MQSIEDIYAPFNFSTTRCYVITFTVKKGIYTKIEHKLPSYIKRLKAIVVTTNARNKLSATAFITLNFNGQAFKSFQMALPRFTRVVDCSRAYPLDEAIEPNSFLQGFFFEGYKLVHPYKVSIYLHYEPVPKD